MAVTVLSRPIGHKLSQNDIEAQLIDSGGDALIYMGSGHSLSDGDYIYIESNFDSYNGFKYVDSIAYDTFKIKDSEGDYVQFKQEATISFRISELDHGWQCVHLPIVYKLYSDLMPNITDTIRTVYFNGDSNGYTSLGVTEDFIDIQALDFIELVGTGPLAGTYQVIDTVGTDGVIINLAYNASHTFTGYTVRKYYQGYYVSVNVYGGFSPSHPWYDIKPMKLLATLKLTPDANGLVKFSIAEILKGQITLRNNLTLDTLPNNTDFWTSFYISSSESYDQSDGEEITLYTSEITTDTFEGFATNSILPFKSLNQGHMSDYVGEQAKWLTTQDRPIAFVDRFFDLSLLKTVSSDLRIVIHKSFDGYVSETEEVNYSDVGLGVLRIPIEPEPGFDEYCITAYDLYEIEVGALTTADNYGAGDETWTISSNPTVTGLTQGQKTKKLRIPLFNTREDQQIDFVLNLDLNNLSGSGGTFGTTPKFYLFNSAMSDSVETGGGEIAGVYISAGNKIESHSLTPDFVPAYFVVDFDYTGAGGYTIGFDINSLTITNDAETQQISETICIDIVEECAATFIDDNVRLTEGGQFRELE